MITSLLLMVWIVSVQPMALREMRRIGETMVARWGVRRVVMVHRLGSVPVSECSVLVRAGRKRERRTTMKQYHGGLEMENPNTHANPFFFFADVDKILPFSGGGIGRASTAGHGGHRVCGVYPQGSRAHLEEGGSFLLLLEAEATESPIRVPFPPIFQVYAEGTSEWKANCECHLRKPRADALSETRAEAAEERARVPTEGHHHHHHEQHHHHQHHDGHHGQHHHHHHHHHHHSTHHSEPKQGWPEKKKKKEKKEECKNEECKKKKRKKRKEDKWRTKKIFYLCFDLLRLFRYDFYRALVSAHHFQ
jgi:hypothetical protein